MISDAIEIVDYDPLWPIQFAEIAARVRQALGASLLVAIEHVGSTAVPGLAAKPIIDLDVVIPSAADLPQAIARLATLGYVHEGDRGLAGREAFHSPPGMARHHLYVCPADSGELRRHRLFRDHLRCHPEEARRYEALKRALATRCRGDHLAYSEGKTAFVQAVLRPTEISHS